VSHKTLEEDTKVLDFSKSIDWSELSPLHPISPKQGTFLDVDDNNQQFFFALVGMAQWALEHPSTSRFEFISHEHVKTHKHLKTAFISWWYAEHPYMTDAQRELFEDSVKHGLCPAGVVEHTPDGHHPIGWSWGSEWYLADFYLCLTRAIIQHAEKVGNDLKNKYAPIHTPLRSKKS
jgi:hypothetical protein